MHLDLIGIAVADTVQGAADSAQTGISTDALIGFGGALLGALVAWRIMKRNQARAEQALEKQLAAFKEQQEEERALAVAALEQERTLAAQQITEQRQQSDREWQRRLEQEQHQKQEISTQRQQAAQNAEDTYLDWITHEHRFLNITGLRTRAPVEVELERVYVSLGVDLRQLQQMQAEEPGAAMLAEGAPKTRRTSRGRTDKDEVKLDIARALHLVDQDRVGGLVVLGGPGTGKTTVLKYLALTFAQGLQDKRLDQNQPRLPIFVSLRMVAAQNEEQALADLLAAQCQAAGCRVDASFFDQRLRRGACIVLLDGLDEVADQDQRRRVAAWISRQHDACANNPFVVTCRVAGFKEEYLPPRFLRLDIEDFNEEDVAHFAHNWCLAVEVMTRGDSDASRRRGERAGQDLIAAVQANQRVKELAINPLMLSIIALVHRYRARLPDKRVDLYSECVDVLLGHWDEAKDMPVKVAPAQALQLLQPLALWMHQQKQGDDQPQAERGEIEPILAEYLPTIGLQADQAGPLLDSIRDRSGLLVERSLDVFAFQHLTFQEYLTAREMAAKGPLEILTQNWNDPYWREVTLLYSGLTNPSALLGHVLEQDDSPLMEQWDLVQQVEKESLALDVEIRHNLEQRPFAILQRAKDSTTAARAAIYCRQAPPDLEALVQCFQTVEDERARGHLALLLGENGASEAHSVLLAALDDPSPHVQYLAALALDISGREDRNRLDQWLMVRIEADSFLMGDDGKKTETDPYQIDRFPLTNGQYRRFVGAGGYVEQKYWSADGWAWREKEKIDKPVAMEMPPYNLLSAPIVGVSWYEGEAYARWAGKRLPTEQEWERAARGDEDGRKYPWGDEFDEAFCNTGYKIKQPTQVGNYPEGISPHGCYDMAGNVWEWTDSWYDENRDSRVLRGGSWSDLQYDARCAFRLLNGPGLLNDDVGFRFSRTVSP